MGMSEVHKRTYKRFPAEPNTLAWISLDLKSDDFRQGIVGLVVNEAHKGCSLVMLENDKMVEGKHFRLLVGKHSPINAELRWRREIEPGVIRVGFEYIE